MGDLGYASKLATNSIDCVYTGARNRLLYEEGRKEPEGK